MDIEKIRKDAATMLGRLEGQHRRCTETNGQIRDAADQMHAASQERIETIQRILGRSGPGDFPKLEREYARLLRDRRRCKMVMRR